MPSEYINRPGDIPDLDQTEYQHTDPHAPKQKPQLSSKTLKVAETYLDEVNKIIILKSKACCKKCINCRTAQNHYGSWSTFRLGLYLMVLGPHDFTMDFDQEVYYMRIEWLRRKGHAANN